METEKENGQNNLIRYMSNPRAFTLRKWFYDLLKVNYVAYDNIIERVSTSLITERDLEEFGKLVGQVYETGYKKAVEDYRKQMEDMGLKVHVVAPSSEKTS